MPYVVTFNWGHRRYSSDEIFSSSSGAKPLKDVLIGLNPRIAHVKDYNSCPRGFVPKRTDDGCMKKEN